MDYRLQVITLSVRDADVARAFYIERVGFALDVDYRPADDFRVVQLTPPGAACSVQFRIGLTDAPPGSARATYLVVTDIEAARGTDRTRRPGRRHPAQVAGRGLEGRLAARCRPAAPRLCQPGRFCRPGRQHVDPSGDRAPERMMADGFVERRLA
jgi:catechol 2,3-dioxygenase-like lactoylglutathione lyase family enzyme